MDCQNEDQVERYINKFSMGGKMLFNIIVELSCSWEIINASISSVHTSSWRC